MTVKAIVLDANALLMPFQFNIHIDQELRRLFGDIPVVVPSSVLGELANATGQEREGRSSRSPGSTRSWRPGFGGDDAVIDVAERFSGAVVTNDRELIRRLRARGIRVVRMRGQHHLDSGEDAPLHVENILISLANPSLPCMRSRSPRSNTSL